MADLVIRGMEMPEYCYECPCHNGENGYCQAYKSGHLYSIERPAKCPIIPLPEGHGRLGDLDALMPAFAKATQEFRDGYTFQWILEHAPTIVPAEGGGEG